jgi:hypothetical protein
MIDSTDVTVVMSNSYAQSDEHEYALNDAPIRRLIGRNDSTYGGIYPADPNQMTRLSSPLDAGVARWEYQSGTRPTVMSEKREITSTE